MEQNFVFVLFASFFIRGFGHFLALFLHAVLRLGLEYSDLVKFSALNELVHVLSASELELSLEYFNLAHDLATQVLRIFGARV
jgi:hypothetical protein